METDPSGIDYSAVLADLKARRAKLDAAIAGIEAVMGLSPSSSESSNPATSLANGSLTEIQPDSFFGMTIPDAAKKFLAMKKRVQGTGDIAEALKRGGIQAGIQGNFPNTVGSVLNRNYMNGGGIVKVGRGTWGLADWYPNKPRKPTRPSANEAGTEHDGAEIELDVED